MLNQKTHKQTVWNCWNHWNWD